MTKLRRFTPLDALFVALLSTGILLSVPILKSFAPSRVQIYRDNQLIAEYPLDEDRVIEIDGKTGPMAIEIVNKSVRVCNTTCPHQICMRSGAIRKPCNQIICAPNHVIVILKVPEDHGYDAVTH